MEKDLLCDACAREAWPDGALVLVLQNDESVKTVRTVRILCGTVCTNSPSTDDDDGDQVHVQSFATIDDVFDYADRVIAAHDWERGTVQRLSRALAAIHQRRSVPPVADQG